MEEISEGCNVFTAISLTLRNRLTEEILHESIEARSDVLSTLRELGPPDLVHLIKQAPRNPAKQVREDSVSKREFLLTLCVDWNISPCHRCRCFFFCQLSCLYQHSHLYRIRSEDYENCGGDILVCTPTLSWFNLTLNFLQLLQCVLSV